MKDYDNEKEYFEELERLIPDDSECFAEFIDESGELSIEPGRSCAVDPEGPIPDDGFDISVGEFEKFSRHTHFQTGVFRK